MKFRRIGIFSNHLFFHLSILLRNVLCCSYFQKALLFFTSPRVSPAAHLCSRDLLTSPSAIEQEMICNSTLAVIGAIGVGTKSSPAETTSVRWTRVLLLRLHHRCRTAFNPTQTSRTRDRKAYKAGYPLAGRGPGGRGGGPESSTSSSRPGAAPKEL